MKELSEYDFDFILQMSFQEDSTLGMPLLSELDNLLTESSIRPYSWNDLTEELGDIIS